MTELYLCTTKIIHKKTPKIKAASVLTVHEQPFLDKGKRVACQWVSFGDFQ